MELYWHIGEATIRLRATTPRKEMGVKSKGSVLLGCVADCGSGVAIAVQLRTIE